ncbi:hypothetical protein B0H10DRAFT_1968423 [Mycena sp. CBHHK59/15]|nr:hypothetical protein B0H10DRAFT_1968423 [Mycena sp. CBHHK59/15]
MDIITFNQHDKWKRFGLQLYVGLDPFPGGIAWLKIWWINRNSKLITTYFLEVCRDPTAPGSVSEWHPSASLDEQDWNVKPEACWSQLRCNWTPGFVDSGVNENLYDRNNPLQRIVTTPVHGSWRQLVQNWCGAPVKTLTGSFWPPPYAGYRWLYKKTDTIHRDISIGNLMFHEIEGKVYGVLNDFDLALRLSDTTPSTSKQRTGTKLYMAIDLLVPKPPYHLYSYTSWSSSPAKWKARKTAAITNEGFPPTEEHFQQFRLRIIGISGLFREGFFKRAVHNDQVAVAELTGGSVPSFDDETLGDSVTFNKFATFLKTPIIQS